MGLEAAILKESVKAHLSSFLASIMYRGSKDLPKDKASIALLDLLKKDAVIDRFVVFIA